MFYDLTLHPLRFTAEALDPLELEQHSGSSLRGALFHALLRRFCMNPTAPTCADCPLNATCPVAELVAPLRDEHPRGRDIPRPFVIQPPIAESPVASLPLSPRERGSGGEVLAPGQSFTFGVTLIGSAARLLPYVIMAAQQMGAAGMGRPLHTNGGRRGRFTLQQIALTNSFAGTEQVLYRRGDQRVAVPSLDLAITPAVVAARASALPADRLTIKFLTPTRLIANGQLARRPDLVVLVARLAERLDALTRQYGAHPSRDTQDGDDPDSPDSPDTWNAPAAQDRARSLATQARTAHLLTDDTHWVDLASYSARQRRATPIGGFVGTATFTTPATLSADLRELLVWGELLHVGKNAVKGDGRYRMLT